MTDDSENTDGEAQDEPNELSFGPPLHPMRPRSQSEFISGLAWEILNNTSFRRLFEEGASRSELLSLSNEMLKYVMKQADQRKIVKDATERLWSYTQGLQEIASDDRVWVGLPNAHGMSMERSRLNEIVDKLLFLKRDLDKRLRQ
jgi:hypothetical protein